MRGKSNIAATAFSEAATAEKRDTSGTVRITTQEIYVITLLAPMLRELHDRHPEIMIELDDSQEFRDLGEGEADIALRSAHGRSWPPASSAAASARRLDALLQPRLCRTSMGSRGRARS